MAVIEGLFDDDPPVSLGGKVVPGLFDDEPTPEAPKLDFVPGAEGSTAGQYIGDLASGAAGAVKSMIPFTSRKANPAHEMPGFLAGAARIPAGIVRGVAAAVGGSAVTAGNPLGGVAALAADRAVQIQDEHQGGLAQSFSEHPIATGADIAFSGAANLVPGLKPAAGAVKGVVAPLATDFAVGAGQGIAQGIEEGQTTEQAIESGIKTGLLGTAISGIKGAASARKTASTIPTEGQVIPDELRTREGQGQTGGQITPEPAPPIGVEGPVINSSPGQDSPPVQGKPADFPEGPIEKRVGSINTTKFAKDQQSGMAITEAYNTNKAAIDTQRGTTGESGGSAYSLKTLKERAAKHEWTDEKVAKLKPNQTLNDEEAHALDNYTVGAINAFKADKSNPELRQRMNTYLKASSGVASAQGRALGARNVVRDAWLNSLEPKDRAMLNLQKFYGDKDIPPKLIDAIVDAKTDADITAAIQKAATKKGGLAGQVNAFRYFNMLSSPMTQGLNTVSNAVSAVSDVYERAAVAAGDTILPGKSQTAKGELGASLKGMATGAADGARKFLYVLQHGYSPKAAKSLDPEEFRPQLAGGAYNPGNWPSRLLDATDQFFSAISENAELSGLAHRRAYKELSGKYKGAELDKKVAELSAKYMEDDQIKASAEEAGKWRTHREKMPQVVEGLAKASKDTPLGLVIPFVRVPYNVTKKIIGNYSPGAVLNKNLYGKAGRAEAIKTASQMALGTATLAAIAPYVMNGDITGALPKDAKEREAFLEAGKKPFSIRLGDRWYDYKMLGGLASPFIMASALWDAYKENDGKIDEQAGLKALGKIGSYAVDSTYLSGLNGVITMLSDPSSFKTESTIAQILSQFVPASSLQRFINNTTAESVPETNSVTDRVIAGTVLQDQLPRRLNSLGQPLKRKGYFPGPEQIDPVYGEMERLGIGPSMPSKELNMGPNQPAVQMTPEEYRTLLASGGKAYQQLTKIVQSPAYQASAPDMQKRRIEAILNGMLPALRSGARSRISATRRRSAYDQAR